MKKLLIIIIILLCCIGYCYGGSNETYYNNDNIINIYDYDEVIYAEETGHFNIQFTEDYKGYCYEYMEEEATKGDKFYATNTSYLDENITNCLKIYFTDYYDETQKDKIVTQHTIWHFTDNFDGWRINKTLIEDIKLTNTYKTIPDVGSKQYNNTHTLNYDFKALVSPYEHHQDFFGYKIWFTENTPIIENNTVNYNNTTNNYYNNTTNIYNNNTSIYNTTVNNYNNSTDIYNTTNIYNNNTNNIYNITINNNTTNIYNTTIINNINKINNTTNINNSTTIQNNIINVHNISNNNYNTNITTDNSTNIHITNNIIKIQKNSNTYIIQIHLHKIIQKPKTITIQKTLTHTKNSIQLKQYKTGNSLALILIILCIIIPITYQIKKMR